MGSGRAFNGMPVLLQNGLDNKSAGVVKRKIDMAYVDN
jgi:hypothetical protein